MRRSAPTADEYKVRREAEQKRDRGERLSRREREVLARPELGMTRSGILESLGRSLDLGRFDLDLIAWAGQAFQQDWPEFLATNPDEEATREWLESRFDDKATD